MVKKRITIPFCLGGGLLNGVCGMYYCQSYGFKNLVCTWFSFCLCCFPCSFNLFPCYLLCYFPCCSCLHFCFFSLSLCLGSSFPCQGSSCPWSARWFNSISRSLGLLLPPRLGRLLLSSLPAKDNSFVVRKWRNLWKIMKKNKNLGTFSLFQWGDTSNY